MRGDPSKEANVWLDKIEWRPTASVPGFTATIKGPLSPDVLRDKLAVLEGIRWPAKVN